MELEFHCLTALTEAFGTSPNIDIEGMIVRG
jgi:hypothetical protein